MQSARIAAIFILVLTLIGAAVAPDPLVTALAGITLVGGLMLLWGKSSIPILLLPFVLQWVSVATKPIESAVTGTDLNSLSEFGGNITASATFALVGLAALAVGMFTGMLTGGDRVALSRLRADVVNWPERTIIPICLVMIVGGHVAAAGARLIDGLSEVMLALSNLTFCGLFILVFWGLATGKKIWLIGAIAALEIVFGLTGFFGVFRTTFFTVALGALCSQRRFNPRTIVIAAGLAVPALFLTVFWSSMKQDYRDFLNNGSQTQTVQQPMSARLNFLVSRAENFDREQFNFGFEALVNRISYIDFLAMTMEYVPTNAPYENGNRTLQAATHIFTPRIIFTDKPPLESDTDVTIKYTGLSFYNATYTSISIGYLGEAYIDFGWYGAIVFTFFYGLAVGICVRLLLSFQGLSPIVNAGLAVMVVIQICYFEQALIKTIGGTTASLIVAFLLQRLASLIHGAGHKR